jgi:hypothetical protein
MRLPSRITLPIMLLAMALVGPAVAARPSPCRPALSRATCLFNGDGTKLVGTLVGTSQIDSFSVGRNGRLTAAPGSPFTAQGLGPSGSEFRPTSPNQLFVTNAHNGVGLGTVSAFDDSANGTLSSIGSSPFADLQTAPCWLVISHVGRFLFAVNTGSGYISSYSIAPGGALALLGSTPVSATGGVGAVDPGLSPDGRYLYVNESRIDAVGAFAVNSGNLSELANSPTPLPTGATPARHRRQLKPGRRRPRSHELGATPPRLAWPPARLKMRRRPPNHQTPTFHRSLPCTYPD